MSDAEVARLRAALAEVRPFIDNRSMRERVDAALGAGPGDAVTDARLEREVVRLRAALGDLSRATGAYVECDERPRTPALWSAMCEAQAAAATLLNVGAADPEPPATPTPQQ